MENIRDEKVILPKSTEVSEDMVSLMRNNLLKEAEAFNLNADRLMEEGMDLSGLFSIKKEIGLYYNIGMSITSYVKEDKNIPHTVVMENENDIELTKVKPDSSDK